MESLQQRGAPALALSLGLRLRGLAEGGTDEEGVGGARHSAEGSRWLGRGRPPGLQGPQLQLLLPSPKSVPWGASSRAVWLRPGRLQGSTGQGKGFPGPEPPLGLGEGGFRGPGRPLGLLPLGLEL